MKKLKDVFYDLNDILVALIIVALAAFVIVSNIDSILAYPSGIAEEIQLAEEETPTNYADNPPITDQGTGDTAETTSEGGIAADAGDQVSSGGGISGNEGAGSTGGAGENGEPVNYSVYINPGSTGDQIADLMISVGLFTDRAQFNTAVAAAGAEGKLQAGNFIIPSDATPGEVISIITN